MTEDSSKHRFANSFAPVVERLTNLASDLEAVTIRAKSLFSTLDLPQRPDALRILDEDGRELFFWSPDAQGA